MEDESLMSSAMGKVDAVRSSFFADKTFKEWHGWAMYLCDKVVKPGVLPCPTAATDGTTIYWDAQFVMSNSINYLCIVLAHEIGHGALYHTSGRGKAMDAEFGSELTNIAMDHAVNNLLTDCGISAPEDWICDRKYKDWSAEDIAHDLREQGPKPTDPDNPDDKEGEGEKGSGKGGGHEKMKESSPEQKKRAEVNTNDAISEQGIKEAITKDLETDEQGDGSIGKLIEAARNARHQPQDWRLQFDEFLGELKSDNWVRSYSKIPRRTDPDLIRPGRKAEGLPHIGVIADTSGSMCTWLPTVMVELEAASEEGFTFDVVCTDGDVYGPYHFEANTFDYRDLPIEGGGGSNMVPAFEKFVDEIQGCDALLFITDGGIRWPKPELLAQVPPCVLVQTSRFASKEQSSYFHKHLHIKERAT